MEYFRAVNLYKGYMYFGILSGVISSVHPSSTSVLPYEQSSDDILLDEIWLLIS